MVIQGSRRLASSEFPTVRQLRRGIIFGTLLRVVMTPPGEAPSDTYHWEGQSLRLVDYSELRGCIAFTPDQIVGAFFNAESERSPFGEDVIPPYDAEEFFAAAAAEVLAIARRDVLPHLVDWLGDPPVAHAAYMNGTTDQLDDSLFAPVITAAFWSEGNRLTAGEPWSDVYLHGAAILRQELSDPEVILAEILRDGEMSDEQANLIMRLYDRRLECTDLPMHLGLEEYNHLRVRSERQRDSAGALLAAIEILLPHAS